VESKETYLFVIVQTSTWLAINCIGSTISSCSSKISIFFFFYVL